MGGEEIAGNAFMILIHLQTQSSTIDMWKGSSEYTPASWWCVSMKYASKSLLTTKSLHQCLHPESESLHPKYNIYFQSYCHTSLTYAISTHFLSYHSITLIVGHSIYQPPQSFSSVKMKSCGVVVRANCKLDRGLTICSSIFHLSQPHRGMGTD